MRYKLLYTFFPILELLNQEEKTFSRKLYLLFNTVISIWVYIFIFILIFPSFGATNIQNTQYIKFYTYTNKNIKEINTILNDIEKELKKNLLFNNAVSITIRDYENNTIYKIINPYEIVSDKSYAITILSKTFLNIVDYNNFKIKRYINDPYPVSLKGIILHEAIHILQYKKYGLLKLKFTIPQWVREGYAEYSASIFMKRDNINNLKKILNKENTKKLNGREKYILWGFMVKHAIEDLNISVDDLHNGKADYNRVLNSLLKNII